jgi:hypothetical protein
MPWRLSATACSVKWQLPFVYEGHFLQPQLKVMLDVVTRGPIFMKYTGIPKPFVEVSMNKGNYNHGS